MAQAVIDIGSETTSVLVAETDGGRISPLWESRYPMLPSLVGARGLAEFVAREAAGVDAAGAELISVLLAPEMKGGHLSRGLARRLDVLELGPLRSLTTAERSKLSFIGATTPAITASSSQCTNVQNRTAVVDLGDAFVSLAVGEAGSRPDWIASRPTNARELTRTTLRSDPPTLSEQIAAAEIVGRQLGNLMPPTVDSALLTGADAGLLALVCGKSIDAKACAMARRAIDGRLSEIVSAQFEIDLLGARRLPGLIVLVEAFVDLLGQPLQVVHGGHIEGVLLTDRQEVESGDIT